MPHPDQAARLRALLAQTELAGTQRRALLLHIDRLPQETGKAHHARLARAALAGLGAADRAQSFELSRGRLAIVWRCNGGQKLDEAMSALDHLLSDLPPGQTMPRGQLATVYDLPAQAAWLLDELGEQSAPAAGAAAPARPLDPAFLARLEHSLAQADLSSFMRCRPVLRLTATDPAIAWEERYIAAGKLAAGLCPDRRIKANPWLFHRLSRSFDRRLLTLLSGPRELRANTPFALHMCIGSILSAEFLRFDSELPSSLRGEVTLYLSAADILADPGAYMFAAEFVHARGYRLLLRRATQALLSLIDVGSAGLDYVQVPFSPGLAADPDSLRLMLPAATKIVLSAADSAASRAWARTAGFELVRAA